MQSAVSVLCWSKLNIWTVGLWFVWSVQIQSWTMLNGYSDIARMTAQRRRELHTLSNANKNDYSSYLLVKWDPLRFGDLISIIWTVDPKALETTGLFVSLFLHFFFDFCSVCWCRQFVWSMVSFLSTLFCGQTAPEMHGSNGPSLNCHKFCLKCRNWTLQKLAQSLQGVQCSQIEISTNKPI